MLSRRRIHQWYHMFRGQVYISFSGGKDSTALADLVWRDFPNVPAVFSNTGLEYPEIVSFVKNLQAQGRPIEIIRPKLSFKQVIDKHGWPVVSKEQSQYINEYRTTKSDKLRETRLNGNKHGRGRISTKHRYLIDAPFKISDKCCKALKKDPFAVYEKRTKRVAIVGTMADESSLRWQGWVKNGCNAFKAKRKRAAPLSFWTEQDVLQYIAQHELDYCHAIYGDIVNQSQLKQADFLGLDEPPPPILKCAKAQRTGCMWCMLGVDQETVESNDGTNRFTRMKETHPVQYKALMEKYGAAEVLDYMGIPH
jgi:3'-phosphoadenosine 5'-phosphosulfate sulfotransferase (PAPS reductase)/FAD synthetase